MPTSSLPKLTLTLLAAASVCTPASSFLPPPLRRSSPPRLRSTTLEPDAAPESMAATSADVTHLESKLTSDSSSASAAASSPVVVEVGLGDRAYPIYIGDKLMDAGGGGALLRKHVTGQQVLVVTNDNIDKWCGGGGVGARLSAWGTTLPCSPPLL